MLDKAKQRMRGYAEDRYHLQLGSAYKLPFAANAFDLVVNNFMLDLLPEKDFAGVLAEFHRVLKPDGRIVLSTMTFGTRWYNRVWETIARHLPSLLTGCRPVEMTRSLAQAGFESIESVHLSQNTFPSEVIRARKVSNAG
jgi:ubiquinone/menaquinone biosynthesis C-methylase UbiE